MSKAPPFAVFLLSLPTMLWFLKGGQHSSIDIDDLTIDEV
jgi:hypothetical protein